VWIGFKSTVCEDTDLIYLAEYRGQWRDFINMEIILVLSNGDWLLLEQHLISQEGLGSL
jgi:hypothetical protein